MGPRRGRRRRTRPRSAASSVYDRLLTRRDGHPGALVALDDGRYAFTGDIVGIGNRASVLQGARRQLRLAQDDSERAWWRNVIGALATPGN